MNPLDVSVIIPIFNAKKWIETSVQVIEEQFRNLSCRYEILLRDDGSSDESRSVLEFLAKRNPAVRCFYNDRNRGLGYTLRKLLPEAGGERIVYLDIDLPFSAGTISKVLDELSRCDVVVVSRYLRKGVDVPLLRQWTSRLYFQMCRVLFANAIQDIGSGMVGMKKGVADLDLEADGFDFHIEFLVEARRRGFSICEMGAQYLSSGQHSFHIFKHGPRVVLDTFRLWWKKR